MEAKAIVAYVVCDDTIKNLKIEEDPQVEMKMQEAPHHAPKPPQNTQ